MRKRNIGIHSKTSVALFFSDATATDEQDVFLIRRPSCACLLPCVFCIAQHVWSSWNFRFQMILHIVVPCQSFIILIAMRRWQQVLHRDSATSVSVVSYFTSRLVQLGLCLGDQSSQLFPIICRRLDQCCNRLSVCPKLALCICASDFKFSTTMQGLIHVKRRESQRKLSHHSGVRL